MCRPRPRQRVSTKYLPDFRFARCTPPHSTCTRCTSSCRSETCIARPHLEPAILVHMCQLRSESSHRRRLPPQAGSYRCRIAACVRAVAVPHGLHGRTAPAPKTEVRLLRSRMRAINGRDEDQGWLDREPMQRALRTNNGRRSHRGKLALIGTSIRSDWLENNRTRKRAQVCEAILRKDRISKCVVCDAVCLSAPRTGLLLHQIKTKPMLR